MRRHLVLPVAALLAAGCSVEAIEAPGGTRHSDHTVPAGHASHAGDATGNASTRAFEQVNHRMHAAMAIDFTGDADIDFLRGMIPHHQAAIDMAKVQIQYGKDPEVRRLASEIIAAQEHETAMMKRWLAKRGADKT